MTDAAAGSTFTERRDPQRKNLRDAFDAVTSVTEWKPYVELNSMPIAAYDQLVEMGLLESRFDTVRGQQYRRAARPKY